VLHVRTLDHTKTLITNKCTKTVLSSIVTHSYMFRPCWVIFRENVCYRYTKAALYSWVRMCCWLCTALFLEACTLRGPGRDRGEYTVNSHAIVKCNPSVTVKKISPWRCPSRVETCRNVLRFMIKISLCICWWIVFLIYLSLFVLHISFSSTFSNCKPFFWKRLRGWNWEHSIPNFAHNEFLFIP
jgi:hypothetical protein